MNYTQNEKLLQVGEENLIIGIDVGSKKHYARAFDWRGIEYSKKAYAFSNDVEGFAGFLEWISAIRKKNGKETVIPGMEPTGHYWFDLALFLRDNGMKPVLVNPLHVKRSKELDDHLPSKNDKKDPKTIAKLIIEGRYVFPYLPEGIYAEIRNASNMRFQVEAELTRNKNRIQRWFAIYFPEYTEVYGSFDAISSIMILRQAALPCDIISLGIEKINQIWREAKVRAAGIKRATTLVEAAQNSVGLEGGEAARLEIWILVNDYISKVEQLNRLDAFLNEKIMEVPNVEKLLAIKGVGHEPGLD